MDRRCSCAIEGVGCEYCKANYEIVIEKMSNTTYCAEKGNHLERPCPMCRSMNKWWRLSKCTATRRVLMRG